MKITAVVDRIEGEFAVLLVGTAERKVDFPLDCLPPVQEGSIINLSMELDESKEQARRQQSADLIEKLLRKQR